MKKHEEADTLAMVRKGDIIDLKPTVDTIVMIIAIKTFHELKAVKLYHLWVDFGKRKSKEYFPACGTYQTL